MPHSSGQIALRHRDYIESAFAKFDIELAGFVLQAESDALRNPGGDRTVDVSSGTIQGHTDRFVLRFVKR